MHGFETADAPSAQANTGIEAIEGEGSRREILVRTPSSENISKITAEDSSIRSESGEKIEILRDGSNRDRYALLKWNVQGGDESIVTLSSTEFPNMNSKWLKLMSLPDRTLPCPPAEELFAQITSTFETHTEMPHKQVKIATAFAMGSWFFDIWPTAPYLWITGPLCSGKSTALRLFHCMCRRGILIGDTTPASLYMLCDQLEPTLLLDESEDDHSLASAQIRRLLRVGSTRGAQTVRNGRPYSTFGYKIIASHMLPSDAALTSRGASIYMYPTQREMPTLNDEAVQSITAEYQAKLMRFRINNYSRVAGARLPFEAVRHLTPRMRNIVQILSAPVMGATGIVNSLISAFTKLDQDARSDQAEEPQWLVAKELFSLAHEVPYDDVVLVGQLANAVNTLRESQGERNSLSPREVGSHLRALGFHTERLGSSGRGLRFTNRLRTQIHQVAARYGLTRRDTIPEFALEYGGDGLPCEVCEKFSLTGGLRFLQRRPAGPQFGLNPSREANVHPK
jgi:hypothetical protein